MTIEDSLQRGRECEAAGDIAGAEAAWRYADGLGDAEGAILVGQVLRRRGDTNGAVDAFQRAESRNHSEAGSCLGNLWSDMGDHDAAKAAYERSVAAGSADALLNLGLMLAGLGQVDEALGYLRLAQDNGDSTASWAIGRLLEDAAKETAARLLATQQDPLYAELLLAGTVEDSVLGTVSTVKALLQANWGPTPTTFIQALAEANELMQENNSETSKTPTM
jgi:tetratricopeptide (TPR) repeat protein